VEVDPVVREGLGLVRHERHHAELAVTQPPRGRDDLGGSRRLEREDELGEGHARQDRVHRVLALEAVVVAQHDRLDRAAGVPHRHAASVQVNGEAAPLDPARELLPELARTKPRVLELLDQGGGVAAAKAQRPQQGLHEAEVLDPLRRPLRLDLGARDAPDLLGVGLEEVRVDAPAEPAHDPVLEAARLRGAETVAGAKVGDGAAGRLRHPQAAKDVGGLERVVEEVAAVVDPREAAANEQLVPQDLLPEPLDLRELGVEAVSAQVEAIPLELDGLGDASDRAVGLQHRPGAVAEGQDVGGGEPGGSGAEDRGAELGLGCGAAQAAQSNHVDAVSHLTDAPRAAA
jgi:hypothetical protein